MTIILMTVTVAGQDSFLGTGTLQEAKKKTKKKSKGVQMKRRGEKNNTAALSDRDKTGNIFCDQQGNVSGAFNEDTFMYLQDSNYHIRYRSIATSSIQS